MKLTEEEIARHFQGFGMKHIFAKPKEDKWISVIDRLPLTPCFVNCIKTTSPNVIGLYFNSSKKFKYASQDHTRNVTHWMPLPDAL